MVRKKDFFGIALVALVCLLLIALYQRDTNPLIRSRRATFQAIQIEDDQPLEEHSSQEDIINAQRSRLRKELYGFKFPSNLSLSNFTIEDGGQPIRTIIFSTWRSGSTFLGDVLNALPGNYYHYEPLIDYGIMQIRGPPDADSALPKLKSLLNCDYKNLYRYAFLTVESTTLDQPQIWSYGSKCFGNYPQKLIFSVEMVNVNLVFNVNPKEEVEWGQGWLIDRSNQIKSIENRKFSAVSDFKQEYLSYVNMNGR